MGLKCAAIQTTDSGRTVFKSSDVDLAKACRKELETETGQPQILKYTPPSGINTLAGVVADSESWTVMADLDCKKSGSSNMSIDEAVQCREKLTALNPQSTFEIVKVKDASTFTIFGFEFVTASALWAVRPK